MIQLEASALKQMEDREMKRKTYHPLTLFPTRNVLVQAGDTCASIHLV